MRKWTKSPNQDFTKDMRGWQKGKTRKYSEMTINTIKEIHKQLVEDPNTFFVRATATIQKWQEKYPQLPPPHPKFIDRVLKEAGLSEKIQKGKNKGVSKYLHYPEYSINQLGESLLEKSVRNRFHWQKIHQRKNRTLKLY